MWLATFRGSGTATRIGARVEVAGRTYLAALDEVDAGPAGMIALVSGGAAALSVAREVVGRIASTANDPAARATYLGSGTLIPESEAHFLPPIPRPGKIISVGINYREHAEYVRQAGGPTPDLPIAFAKLPSSLIGHGQPIVIPRQTQELDYEIELCAVIGTRCRDVTPERALDFVAGYTVFNDLTARDIQRTELQRRAGFLECKSLDTMGPCGPYLVTADEFEGAPQVELTLRVNGETRQHDHTRNMLFDVAAQVAYWSRLTLEPGDLLTTGSPMGVAMSRPDPASFYLRAGDVVEAEIERIGILRNPVIAEAGR